MDSLQRFVGKYIWSSKLPDIVCSFTLLFIAIPFGYWLELFVVVPYFFPMWSGLYILFWALGNFLVFNMTTNLIALMVCDTSIKGKVLSIDMKPNWRLCSTCECLTPPRSWHCNVCKTCVLKRDHHCMFGGACIGHYNHRYFYIFLLYVSITLIACTVFTSVFIYQTIDLQSVYWLTFLFPLAMLVLKISFANLVLLFYMVIIVTTFIVLTLFIMHSVVIKNNQMFIEKSQNIDIYDIGVMNNIKTVLGKRWYLTWICPFIKSELIQDGVNWQIKETGKNK